MRREDRGDLEGEEGVLMEREREGREGRGCGKLDESLEGYGVDE